MGAATVGSAASGSTSSTSTTSQSMQRRTEATYWDPQFGHTRVAMAAELGTNRAGRRSAGFGDPDVDRTAEGVGEEADALARGVELEGEVVVRIDRHRFD